MQTARPERKITKLIIVFCVVLVSIFLIQAIVPTGESKNKISDIFLTRPTFAQESTTFPADEAGISAYVNAGQNIDLAKVKSALRGIEAEGSNYVIGIIELTGLPQEEFPHMYVTTDGWILAYYSKFAPASRLMQWYGYEGRVLSTNTLQDAIAKFCNSIGMNYANIKSNIGYYHFNYPEATKLILAVRAVNVTNEVSFNYSIPYGVILHEASYSHYSHNFENVYDSSELKIDGESLDMHGYSSSTDTLLTCNNINKGSYLVPDKSHALSIKCYFSLTGHTHWTGAAIVFIYR